jgi:drug/metabolite transporter (DMT)-like permease
VLRYLILSGAQLAVGAAAIFARFALGGASALAVSAWRLAIAAAVLLVIAAFTRHVTPLALRERRLLAIAGVALAIHFATWIGSLEYTSVAISLLLVATTPLWTALIDFIFYRRALSFQSIVAFCVGAIGLVLVVVNNSTPAPHPGYTIFGCVLAVAGAITFAIYLTLVRSVRAQVDLRVIVSHTYTWAAAMLLFATLIARQPPPALTDTSAWLGILAMALVSQLLGHTAMNASLRWFSPSAVGFSTLLEPVIGAIAAFFIFHEAVAPLAIGGGLLVLAGGWSRLTRGSKNGLFRPANWTAPLRRY